MVKTEAFYSGSVVSSSLSLGWRKAKTVREGTKAAALDVTGGEEGSREGKPRVGGHGAALTQAFHVPPVPLSSLHLPYRELDEGTAVFFWLVWTLRMLLETMGMQNILKWKMLTNI